MQKVKNITITLENLFHRIEKGTITLPEAEGNDSGIALSVGLLIAPCYAWSDRKGNLTPLKNGEQLAEIVNYANSLEEVKRLNYVKAKISLCIFNPCVDAQTVADYLSYLK